MSNQHNRNVLLQTILTAIMCFGVLRAQVSQLIGLDVKCDEQGMNVRIEFDAPFNGIIYSKGYYKDMNCRFVTSFSGNHSYHFFIRRKSDCALHESRLTSNPGGMRSYEVTIIIQHDPMVVDSFDFSRQLQCNWFRHLRKTVTHSPIPVLSLTESRVAYPGAEVDVWMDVQKGDSPFAPLLSGNVPIGEKLTVSLYLNDGANRFDLQVRRCHAYDAGNFTDQNTQRLALTDRHGCSTRPHLLSTFLKVKHLQNRPELTSRLTNDRARTANVMVYAVLNAFRFPEQSDVYVSCSVEVCSGECDNSCQPEVNSPDDPIPIPQPQRPLKPHHHHHSKRKPQQQVEIKIPNMSVSNSTPLLNDVDQESEFNNVHVIRDDSNENDTAITANFLFNAFNQQDSLATIALNSGPKLVTSHDLVTGHRLSANDTRWNESLPINVTSRTLTVRDRSPESQLNGSRLVIVSTELPGRATFGQLRSNRINRVDRTRRINSKSMQNF